MLIELTKAVGDEKFLVNTDHIVYVEQSRRQDSGDECSNLYVVNREMLKVVETVGEIYALVGRAGIPAPESHPPVAPPEVQPVPVPPEIKTVGESVNDGQPEEAAVLEEGDKPAGSRKNK